MYFHISIRKLFCQEVSYKFSIFIIFTKTISVVSLKMHIKKRSLISETSFQHDSTLILYLADKHLYHFQRCPQCSSSHLIITGFHIGFFYPESIPPGHFIP